MCIFDTSSCSRHVSPNVVRKESSYQITPQVRREKSIHPTEKARSCHRHLPLARGNYRKMHLPTTVALLKKENQHNFDRRPPCSMSIRRLQAIESTCPAIACEHEAKVLQCRRGFRFPRSSMAHIAQTPGATPLAAANHADFSAAHSAGSSAAAPQQGHRAA